MGSRVVECESSTGLVCAGNGSESQSRPSTSSACTDKHTIHHARHQHRQSRSTLPYLPPNVLRRMYRRPSSKLQMIVHADARQANACIHRLDANNRPHSCVLWYGKQVRKSSQPSQTLCGACSIRMHRCNSVRANIARKAKSL